MIQLFNHISQGTIGLGKLSPILQPTLEYIKSEYDLLLPSFDLTTHHAWVSNLSPTIQSYVNQIAYHSIWENLCPTTGFYKLYYVKDMSELYYSNPKHSQNRTLLYGAAANVRPHTDCFFRIPGVRLYRVLIGLSEHNNHTKTYFPAWNIERYINKGDYLIFDFDRTVHQVIQNRSENNSARYLLKTHYLVYSNIYPKWVIPYFEKWYIYYDYFSRWFLKVGTDPKQLHQFVFGWFMELFLTPYVSTITITFIITVGWLYSIRYAILPPILILFGSAFIDWSMYHSK